MAGHILNEKLESLRRCVARIEEKRAPSVEALLSDADRQDILAINITRAVQICVDMAAHVVACNDVPAPATMGEAFDGLQHLGIIDAALCSTLKAAVGFRNVAVHSYQAIDWEIVHAIAWHRLEEFRAFAIAIRNYLESARDFDER